MTARQHDSLRIPGGSNLVFSGRRNKSCTRTESPPLRAGFQKGLIYSAGICDRCACRLRTQSEIAIRDFAGEAQFAVDGTSIDNGRLNVTIQAHSLEVTDDMREKDRKEIHRQMYDEVLETDRYAEITYECSRVSASGSGDSYWVALNGDLTLHGVTRPLPISARVVISADTLRASGEFTVRQSDYDIAPVTVAAGALKLKDEVKITFDIVARKQP